MENNIIEKIIQNLLPLKIPTERLLAILLLMSLFAITMPMDILQKLSLANFIDNNRAIISAIFLFTSAYFLIEIVFKFYDKIKDYNCYRKRIELLNNLPQIEKDIVIKMYNNGHSHKYSLTNPQVASLCNKNIIYRSTSVGVMDSFGYTMQPWVVKYINTHKNYIN